MFHQLRFNAVRVATFAAVFGFLSLPASALEVGQEAPCVVLKGINAAGQATEGCIRDQEKETQEFTIVEFFSILCTDCEENLPRVSALAADVEATTTTRLVSIDSNVEEVKEYVAQRSELINFPVAFDVNLRAMLAYKVLLTPHLFVLDKNNVVRYVHEGKLTDADVANIKEIVSGETVEPEELKVGDTAPCVVLDGLSSTGEETKGCIRDQEQEAQKYTILEFASITCRTCAGNLPLVQKIAARSLGNATTRLVYVNGNEEAVRSFVSEQGLRNVAVSFDVNQRALGAYKLQKAPGLFVLDKDNTVVYAHKGALTDVDVESIVAIVNSCR